MEGGGRCLICRCYSRKKRKGLREKRCKKHGEVKKGKEKGKIEEKRVIHAKGF
jgi:hypothetical protein